MCQQRYPLAVHSWKTSLEPVIIRCSYSGDIIGSFPLDFVRSSGVDSWEFIFSVIQRLVVVEEGYSSIIRDSHDIVVDPIDRVRSGVFTFEQVGQCHLTLKRYSCAKTNRVLETCFHGSWTGVFS